MEELGYEVSSPIPMHCDNKGAVDLALNPVTGRRSKHIPIKYHAIREYVEAGAITLVRTPCHDPDASGHGTCITTVCCHIVSLLTVPLVPPLTPITPFRLIYDNTPLDLFQLCLAVYRLVV